MITPPWVKWASVRCPPGGELDTDEQHTRAGGGDRRRRFTVGYKRRVVEESLAEDTSVSVVARLKRWRFGRSSERLDAQIAQLELTLKYEPNRQRTYRSRQAGHPKRE